MGGKKAGMSPWVEGLQSSVGSAEGVALGRVDVPYSQALPGSGLGSWLPTASLSPETPRVPFGHLDNSFVLPFNQSCSP